VVSLLDVNVLVALLVPEHEHHVRAVDWFVGDGIINGWSTCALTELGVIRVCAQLPGGVRLPDTTARALLVLTASSPGYVWWPDAVSPVLLQEVRSAATGKQVTDRYLLGFARRNGGQVATFDLTVRLPRLAEATSFAYFRRTSSTPRYQPNSHNR
jgi:predicted nucleic acid-binding protein